MSQNKETDSSTATKHRRISRPGFVVLCAILLLLLIFLSTLFQSSEETNDDPRVENSRDQEHLYTVSPSEPISLRIPSIGLDAEFEDPLGIDINGEIEVPEGFEKVARYIHGPTPGETGPSVILGHVDSLDGPAIFYPLGQIEKGDLIEIDRKDETVAVFRVTKIDRVEQRVFPSEDVYGDIPYSGVRLITCSGTYNQDSERYSHNLIVYGELEMIKTPTGEIKRTKTQNTRTQTAE